MYWASKQDDVQALICSGDAPNLKATDRFWRVIETLPSDCLVPKPLIKLGLLTGELAPDDDSINVEFSADDFLAASTAVLPPVTHKAVRHLLYQLSTELDDEAKNKIGKLCEVTGLNRPPEEGNSIKAVKEAAPDDDAYWPDFFVKQSITDKEASNKNKSKTESRVTDEDDPLASGKRITKKGGERITGKNPFADPERIKDIGLHHGGN